MGERDEDEDDFEFDKEEDVEEEVQSTFDKNRRTINGSGSGY